MSFNLIMGNGNVNLGRGGYSMGDCFGMGDCFSNPFMYGSNIFGSGFGGGCFGYNNSFFGGFGGGCCGGGIFDYGCYGMSMPGVPFLGGGVPICRENAGLAKTVAGLGCIGAGLGFLTS